MLKKHQIINVEIESMEFPNIGIGYHEGQKIRIKQGLTGETAEVRIFKIKNGAHAKIIRIIKESPLSIMPECDIFDICGGCSYQNISHEDETRIKENMVLDIFKEAEIEKFDYLGIVDAPEKCGYRNKMEYSFGDEVKDGDLCLGLRKRGTYYEVVNTAGCKIVHMDFGDILQYTLEFFRDSDDKFFHKMKLTGSLRNLVIRKGYFTDEILVNIVTTDAVQADLNIYADGLLKLNLSGHIVGILHTFNHSVSDAVKAEKVEMLYGRDYYMEKLLGLDFRISAFSFFQTNSRAAELLYSTVREFAGDASGKTIFDLYCGTGTIAQIISNSAKKVIGIELIEEAVAAARDNAKSNGIENCEFIAGDVLKMVDILEDRPDVIILDPPREGVHPKAIKKIIDFGAETIIYISCKPTSLKNDLCILLENGYTVEKVKLHDLFPRTAHIETVVLLRKSL